MGLKGVVMFKKILAIGMSLTLIMASGAMITLAEVEHDGQIVESGSETFDAIDTSDSYGAIADPSETAGAGSASISVDDDVTVNYSGIGETSTAYEDIYGAGAISDTHDDQTSVKVGGDVTVTNNSNSNLDTTGVSAKSDGNRAKAAATVGGDITVTNNNSPHENTGIRASADGEGAAASVTAGGNVSVKSTDGSVSGIIANIGDEDSGKDDAKDATVNVDVKGNVTANSTNADAYGVTTGAMVENSSTTVNVTGNVSAASTNGGANGITTVAEGENASVKVTVGGDVSSSSTNGEGAAYGIYSYSLDGGDVDITLEKNLTVTGSAENVCGIMIMSGDGDIAGNDTSSTKINIRGDLNSSGSGIAVMQDSGTVDIVIEGTLKSQSDAVLLGAVNEENPTDNLNITVWKIESGTNSIVGVADLEEDFGKVSEETRQKVEQSINYIIKIDENQTNSISLSNTRKINDLDTARATEEVAVKLNIPKGYRLLDAYSDVNHTVKLQGNSKDGYYLVVPSGGGVYVSLSLARIENYFDDDDDDDDDYTYRGNFIGNIRIDSLSDDDYKFDENTGVLTITIPSGTNAFNLDSSVLLTFIAKGMNTLYLDTVSGKYSIPVTDIKDLIIEGNVLTFVIGEQKVDIFIKSTLVRQFYPVAAT